jgi:hypothetical protein
MIEALEHYAAREGWQIEQTRATVAALEAGTLETIDLDDLIAEDLAAGEIMQEDLDEACARYAVIA